MPSRFFARPRIAGVVARVLQAGTRYGAEDAIAEARRRVPHVTTGIETIWVPTRYGRTRATVYRPPNAGESPPVHVNLHGGGFVLGITDLDDPVCRILADASGSIVVNPDYVVAPQRPFPAAPYQALDIVDWVARHGHEHGWEGDRLTVGGQSAGGALAAAVARLAFERGAPRIALQALHYPPLDFTIAARDKPSPADEPQLRPWMGDVFEACYLPDPAQRAHRLASPACPDDTADLTGIAPAVIVTAERDILRREAARYADRLAEAGALVEHSDVPGVDHGYDAHDDDVCEATYRSFGEHIARAHGDGS